MASRNHAMHGLGILELSPTNLEWYKVMLIILPNDASISLL